MKVIGDGFGRTGTTSLKVTLEVLDFGPCHHMTEVFEHPEHADFWISAWHTEPAEWEGVLFSHLNDAARLRHGTKAVRTLTTAVPVALGLSIASALVLLHRRAGW